MKQSTLWRARMLNEDINKIRMAMSENGEHGKKYYCWATILDTPVGTVAVATRQYRKNDCFVVYKMKDNEEAVTDKEK